jgi:biopolymer transport protein ExbD
MLPVSPEQPVLLARQPRRRPLIGLTPLIDVVFILLVFFMLASSYVDWRAIELTAPSETAAGGPVEGALLIEIRPEGLRFGGEWLPLETVVQRSERRLTQFPQTPVLVKPAAGVSLQQTVTVLDRLVAVGAVNLSVIRDSMP